MLARLSIFIAGSLGVAMNAVAADPLPVKLVVKPLLCVIDKNATASVSASVMRNTHRSVIPNNTKARNSGTTTQNAVLLVFWSCSSLYSCAIAVFSFRRSTSRIPGTALRS